MGNFVMPKHTGSVREFTVPLKVCYEKKNENEGWIPNGHATRKEEGFTYSIYKEYNRLGDEVIPKTDNSDYTKDAQIPLYFGFIEGRGHNNAEKRITPKGIKMHEAIEANDIQTQYELLIDAFETKTFGRNNQGFPTADSDVEVPNVLLLSSIFLDGVTRQEFYYVIFLMHTKGWDLARAVAEIMCYRETDNRVPEVPNNYADCKLIPLFVSIRFLTEDSRNRLYISKNVYNDFAERIFRLRSKNEEIVDQVSEQCNENELESDSSPLQIIYYGTPGSGKSHSVKKLVKDVNEDYIFRTTFHPDSDYASFVGCYKPVMKDDVIKYEFCPQTFTKAYVKAWKNPEEQIYLIIEEINRGNCAQIFGDLFQLLDRKNGVSEYPIDADNDLKDYLEKELGVGHDGIANGKLKLPANFNILATMNTSDQSLFPMDSAFKRRWSWKCVPVDYKNPKSVEFTITVEDKSYKWHDFLEEVNQRIVKATDSEDKQMGNFFIIQSVKEDEFVDKVMFYLWNDVCKEEFRTNNNFFRNYTDDKKTESKEFTFNDLFGDNKVNILLKFMEYIGVEPIKADTLDE